MNIGGPAIQVTNLMQSLPDSRFEQLLISGICEVNEKDYLDTHDIKINVRKIKSLGRALNPISDLISLFKIRNVIKSFAPDIIHTHTFKAGLIGRIAAGTQSRKILLVHTFHGHLLHSYFGAIGTKVVIALESILARKTTRLISVGKNVQRDLLQHGIGTPSQYKVINPGFKMNLPELISRKSFGFAEDEFICGWFGRIEKVKRADRVLEIAKLSMSSSTKQVKFIIVGDGGNRKQLEAQAFESNLPVKFLGWQSDVSALMMMCNLVICTSENEGTPISLIEAQMLGRPVVSTDVGSVQEVMIPDRTGFVLNYGPQVFWEKITFFMDNVGEYRKFCKESSRFAFENFSLDKFISQHVSLYNEVLAVKPLSRP
jgi:glycosyltransferase involved in cell wall biosynthesis